MTDSPETMAQEVAQLIAMSQLNQTGHVPQAITVVLNQDTIVVTLHGAMTSEEQAAAMEVEGAADVRAHHHQMFAHAGRNLRRELERITGVAVSDATVDVEPTTGAIIAAFTSGTMVQTFLMSRDISEEAWHGNAGSKQA